MARARSAMPGGETRWTAYWPPYPITIERGESAHVWDLDGNRYVDVLNNFTSTIHGHASPRILEAASAALTRGSAFPAPNKHVVLLGELLVSRLPAVDLVRFTNSGTEAAILALRIARRATGRRRFVMFDGGFHGSLAEALAVALAVALALTLADPVTPVAMRELRLTLAMVTWAPL